jgi:hypothetical protein
LTHDVESFYMSSIGPSPFSSFQPPTGKTGATTGAASINNDGASSGPMSGVSDSAGGGKAQAPPISSLFTADLRLNAMQVSRLLRQLLQLPAEMVALLALLAQLDSANKPDLLKKLLNGNVDISLEEMQALLLERLAKSEDKLVKLLQASPMGSGAMEDGTSSSLLELLRIRGELASRTGSSPAEALRTLILLYLPSYPSQDAQRVSLLFLPMGQKHPDEEATGEGDDGFPSGSGSGEDTGSGSELRWLIVIQTVSVGLFHIVLSMSRPEATATPQSQVSTQTPPVMRLSIGYEPAAVASLDAIRIGLEGLAEAENLAVPELRFKARVPRTTSTEATQSNNMLGASETLLVASAQTPSVSIQPVEQAPAIGIHWAYRVVRLILDIDNTYRSSST